MSLSARVKVVLYYAERYAHISARVARLYALNKPVGKIVGDRIAAMSCLRTQLQLLQQDIDKLTCDAEHQSCDLIARTNWENEH